MCAATTAAVSGVLNKCGSIGVRTRASYLFLADVFQTGLDFSPVFYHCLLREAVSAPAQLAQR